MENNGSNVENKAKKIKAILCDVDGVLTNGGITYGDNDLELKTFNVKDGQIISVLQDLGFYVGVITGRSSPVVERRCKELSLDFHRHGVSNKLVEYDNFKRQFTLADEEISFIGDDIIDLAVLYRCGLSVAPADAINYIKENVDLVTISRGGEGVFREAADFILTVQNRLETIINDFKK